MTLIAIDTCANLCAVNLWRDGQTIAQRSEDIGRGHGDVLVEMIDSLLNETKLEYQDLSRVGVCIGPGSFTGVRVGVAAARSLAIGLSIPCIGVNALEGLAFETASTYPNRKICTILDARRNSFYIALYDQNLSPILNPCAVNIEELCAQVSDDFVLCGTGAENLIEYRQNANFDYGLSRPTPDIATIAALAQQKPISLEKPKPLYIRAPDAKVQQGFAVARGA